MIVTKEHAVRFLELCDAGLSEGLGQQEPGQMCIEACWNAALGLPHGDDPPCVGRAVRAAKIALNDAMWSSNKARAKEMRAIGIAQAGSDQVDQTEFARLIAEGYAAMLLKFPAKNTARAARHTAEAARYTAEAARHTARAAEYTAQYTAYTAYAAQYTAYAARHTAYAAKADTDEVLSAFADVILDALKALKSPGCDFLYLLDTANYNSQL